jgi:hypothetical protein
LAAVEVAVQELQLDRLEAEAVALVGFLLVGPL